MFKTCPKYSNRQNRVGAVFLVCIQYLHQENILAEVYHTMNDRDVLKDLRVDRKEEKRLNRVHQWCIVLCHGNFKVIELYNVKRWMKVITESPYTTYFPIANPLIRNANNI